jgi:hypothetical protein
MRTVKYTIELDVHRERWAVSIESVAGRYYVWVDTLAQAFEWIREQENTE